MATGGTIPTNRTQLVTFYNTTGIIEREKNIYYVPRFSKTGARPTASVRNEWLSAFNSVCSSSTNYTNINIASWSPEDRTLVIQGNIDDFRLVSEEGDCLNYFIISRVITKPNSVRTYYYAFFITGVQQLGGSSIQITCVPDDFTNVFYLHNEHGLTATEIANDYEPFNEVMKNCYVNRQHYNRVKIEENEIVPDNMKIFLNQEETFKFKYQYRDYKRNIYEYVNFNDTELATAKSAVSLSSLSDSLRKKVIIDSLYYLVLETRGNEALSEYQEIGNAIKTHKLVGGNLVRGINKPNYLVSYPFINPDKWVNLYDDLKEIRFKFSINGTDTTTGNYELASANDIYKILNTEAISNYIFGAYIIKENCINVNKISISYNSVRQFYVVTFNLILPFTISTPSTTLTQENKLEEGFYLGGITNDKEQTSILELNFEGGTPYIAQTNVSAGIMVSGYNSKFYYINIEENIPNLISNYYDPVLEAEPYGFYGVSYNSSFEFVLNKNRYFYGLISQVSLNYIISINGAIKIGIIPSYEVDNYTTNYYNEGLVFTLTSSLPLVSDSYKTYYYENQAQMKNQFAVNDYNRRTDLLQHLFVSGPNAVGVSAGRGGKSGGGVGAGVGALIETGNQVMQMVDEGIDWKQSNVNIEMNQKAKLADVGNKPDTVKQAGSDVFYDLETNEFDMYINHYTIDELSYNSIAKLLERSGYQVNLYDTLHVVDRVGWNFIKLNGFDFASTKIMASQEDSIRKIFQNGVTLLHDKTYLTSGHNYETILEGGD